MIAPTAVRFDQVHKVYDGAVPQHALRGISLAVAPGSFCVIEGPSGSGKTTLLAIAGGLERATEGRVWVSGQEISALSSGKLLAFRRAELSFVFQDFKLIDVLTAEENVALTLTLRGTGGAVARSRARGLLDRLGLAARLQGRPVELSGGEKQRVAIARALVAEPRVLLADEPTANLDWENGQEVVGLLRGIARERGTTVIVVSHDSRLGALADQRIRIADGSLNGSHPTEDAR